MPWSGAGSTSHAHKDVAGKGQGLFPAGLLYSSRKARRIWSCIGFSRKDTTVRSSVSM